MYFQLGNYVGGLNLHKGKQCYYAGSSPAKDGDHKKELEDLTEANDYDKIFSDYFNTFIVSQCNKVDDVVDGVPNRHGVSHSWYHSYPSKKASLNAILLTDFIIGLEPLEGTRVSA